MMSRKQQRQTMGATMSPVYAHRALRVDTVGLHAADIIQRLDVLHMHAGLVHVLPDLPDAATAACVAMPDQAVFAHSPRCAMAAAQAVLVALVLAKAGMARAGRKEVGGEQAQQPGFWPLVAAAGGCCWSVWL